MFFLPRIVKVHFIVKLTVSSSGDFSRTVDVVWNVKRHETPLENNQFYGSHNTASKVNIYVTRI